MCTCMYVSVIQPVIHKVTNKNNYKYLEFRLVLV